MRAVATGLALLAALVVGPAAAGDESAPPAPTQRTVTRGSLPSDLAGRWLGLRWTIFAREQGDDLVRTVPDFWVISHEGGGFTLTARFVVLPAAQKQALDAANKANRGWKPTEADLREIAAGWDDLPLSSAPLPETVETEMLAPESFDDALRNEVETSGALWAVRQQQIFPKRAIATAEEARVYGLTVREGNGYRGRFSIGVTAMAPLPLPLAFSGEFGLYRMDPPARSLVKRLLDLFRGCGAR